MVKKTISEQTQGDNNLAADALGIFETGGNTFQAKFAALVLGLTIVTVHSAADLPPLVGGFRRLEQDKVYLIDNQVVTFDEILIPAGWNGFIVSSHVPRNSLVYFGSGTLFNTLHLDGIIDSIADSTANPTTHITVTTSSAHGLAVGDYVNIRDTDVETDYSEPRLIVTTVGSTTTFDVEIPFTGSSDTGTFDTGALGLLHFPAASFASAQPGIGSLYDVDFTPDPQGVFSIDNFAAFDFENIGTIRKCATASVHRAVMTFHENGIVFENCDAFAVNASTIFNINVLNTTSKCITATGADTRAILITEENLKCANPGQRPIRIDPTVTLAQINISDSPDNEVATDYFDTSAGGLDETNPQINAQNNGMRKNSQTIGAGFVNGNLTDTVITDNAFKDIDFGTLLASVNLERFTLSNSTNGEFTYIGEKPMSDNLVMTFTAKKTTGGASAVEYEIKFVKDSGVGFVDLDDPVIVPVEISTDNDNSSYLSKVNLIKGDKIKPQIRSAGAFDNVLVGSASIIM